MVHRAPERDLLDLGALRRAELGGRLPVYLGANESKPSALKLRMTSLTRSSEAKAILAMAGRPCAEPTTAQSGSSPSHHRAGPPRDDLRELVALFVGDVPDLHAVCHAPLSATWSSKW